MFQHAQFLLSESGVDRDEVSLHHEKRLSHKLQAASSSVVAVVLPVEAELFIRHYIRYAYQLKEDQKGVFLNSGKGKAERLFDERAKESTRARESDHEEEVAQTLHEDRN